MHEKIVMKRAILKDFKKNYDIILECAAWLKANGIQQWNPPYPINRFRQDINEGKVHYFISEKKIVGTATLSTKKPFYYSGKIWKSGSKVLYLTRFAVPRKLKNLGIGKKLLNKIEKEAKARKIKRLRIDIPNNNKKLREYYISSGFVQVKKAILINTPSILMEKRMK